MKKNKRLIFLILVTLLVVALGLSACQPAPATEEAAEEAAPAPEEEVEEAEPAEEAEEVQEPLRIAFLYGSTANDYSWNQLWDEGRQALDEHFGDKVETFYVEMVPWSEEATHIMEQVIADGADVVVETSNLGDFYYAVVEAHPEVKFFSANPAVHENEVSYMFDVFSAHYINGVAAGAVSETGKIGYVASFPAPWNNAWMSAMVLGIRSVNPEATLQVTYVGSYYDPPTVTQASQALADAGVDVLMSYPNVDASMSVAEERGLWTFGRYHPMGDFAPNQYVTTFLVESGNLFISEVQAILDGTWEGGRSKYINIGDDIYLDAWGPNVPQDVIDQTQAAYDEILGGYNPFIGPILDTEGNVAVPDGEVGLSKDLNIWMGIDWLVAGTESTE